MVQCSRMARFLFLSPEQFLMGKQEGEISEEVFEGSAGIEGGSVVLCRVMSWSK
jgi:hypothetical protein